MARVGEAPAFAFVVATNVVLTLPLALAALLPRFALPACGVGLVSIALGTWAEFSLLGYFIPGGPRSPDPDVMVMFWIMNFTQAAWVLAGLGILRRGGYRLGSA